MSRFFYLTNIHHNTFISIIKICNHSEIQITSTMTWRNWWLNLKIEWFSWNITSSHTNFNCSTYHSSHVWDMNFTRMDLSIVCVYHQCSMNKQLASGKIFFNRKIVLSADGRTKHMFFYWHWLWFIFIICVSFKFNFCFSTSEVC